ncbi:response regulator [Terrihabitans rhizophilus]|jgi:two-component system, cell cycle response regulator CpdR|uniref:Response regulator n=1 Tax=Terrihabitans rhizophilus TaxID=3092662 RepID=A0ABU4RV72_9HYPH|nr:response regulator [Terrihabitans sp. PJ23]MDX6806776.1 response regulator [Terrihabitans sp. PJ23]
MARILVVDDEESIRGFVSRALMLDGHRVEIACDGAEAFDTLSADPEGFDLLLSDIRMPLMDGIDLAKSAASQCPALTILLMTGYAHQRERADDLDRVIHDVLSKPFSLADIRGAVVGALQSRRQAA